MKKLLSLALALVLALGLAAPAFAVYVEGETPDYGEDEVHTMMADDLPQEVDAPIPAQFVGVVCVDGVELDLTGIPGAPAGYIPMRAFCEATDAYVDWYAEDNEAFFMVDGLGVVVNLGTLAVTCDFEPVEEYAAYLDPAGYTFLPVDFLATFKNIAVDSHPEMSSVRWDITTIPERTPLETLAYDIADAAQLGGVMALDPEYLEALDFHMDSYVELVPLYPMMSANPSSVFLAEVAEGRMADAKADFAAMKDQLMASMGNYPSSAEIIEAGQIVESPDRSHLMLVVSFEGNATAIDLFNAAFPSRER